MSSARHLSLSRAFASQAAAYVIDVGGLLSPSHACGAFADMADNCPGESCLISPTGRILAGPAEAECALMADRSAEGILRAKATSDVAGHYSRPDVFRLHVNRLRHRNLAAFDEPPDTGPAPHSDPEGPAHTPEPDQ